MRNATLLTSVALLLASSAAPAAENGVFADKVVIGEVTTLSGVSSGRPIEKKTGSDIYFAKLNSAGGVGGRKIEIKSYDDKYEPERTSALAQKLIDEDKVFCLFEPYGTATSQALVPIVTKANIPLLFPSTGAESLRTPVIKMVYNLRLSSFMEAEALVNYAVDQLKIKEIGLFYQDDFYGTSMKSAAHRAASRRQLTIAAEGSHRRESTDVSAAVDIMDKKKPGAVLLLSLFRQSERFINVAKEKNYSPVYLVPQSVLTEEFVTAIKKANPRIFISQGLPSLEQIEIPIVKQFRDAMAAAGHKTPSMTMFEGYVEAAVLVEALKRAGAEPTRKSLIAALDQMSNADVGGISIHFSESNHQGIQTVYVSELRSGGKTIPIK